MTRVFGHSGGGLDRGDRADHGNVERRAGMVERDGRGGVAGDDGKPRPEALDQAGEQGGHPLGEVGIAPRAIGKTGAVGGIDDRRGGQERAGRAEHRQAADAGIEEEQRGVGSIAAAAWRGLIGDRATLRGEIDLLPSARDDTGHAFALALGYLLGSIPFGLLLTRLRRRGDIRDDRIGQYRRDQCASNRIRKGWRRRPCCSMREGRGGGADCAATVWPEGEYHAPRPGRCSGISIRCGSSFAAARASRPCSGCDRARSTGRGGGLCAGLDRAAAC